MDETSLKKQFESMGASLKFRALPIESRRAERQLVLYKLGVEAGPHGEVVTFVCRPAVRSQAVAQVVEVCPR